MGADPRHALSPERARATTSPRALLAWLTIAGVVLLPLRAEAYCRTTTARKTEDNNPSSDVCRTGGLPVWWRNRCVGYSVQQSGSRKLSYDAASDAIKTAFRTWSDVPCSDDDEDFASITVKQLIPVSCGQISYRPNAPNQNVVVFRDDLWPYPDPSNVTLALTTVNFDVNTGEILDADMEINTGKHTFATDDEPPADAYDLVSVLTHEAGHFLGLAHSEDSDATMYAREPPGTTHMRDLSPDDVEGICEVYRPNGYRAVANNKITPAETCDPTPRQGFTDECAPARRPGCEVASGKPGGTWLVTLAGLVPLTVGLRRLRMRRRTS